MSIYVESRPVKLPGPFDHTYLVYKDVETTAYNTR